MVKRMVALAVLLTLAQNSEAEIYRWIDSKGVVNYSTTPPAVPKLQEVRPMMNTPAVTRPDVSDDSSESYAGDSQEYASDQEYGSEAGGTMSAASLCSAAKANLRSSLEQWRQIGKEVYESGKNDKARYEQGMAAMSELESMLKVGLDNCAAEYHSEPTLQRVVDCAAARDDGMAIYCVR